MKIKSLAIALAAVVGIFSSQAQAATYTYTISGATMNDGAQITGSFGFDDVTSLFNNVMMSLTGASVAMSDTGELFNGSYDTAALIGPVGIVFGRSGFVDVGDPALGFFLSSSFAALNGGSTALTLIAYGNCAIDCPVNSMGGLVQTIPTAAQISGKALSTVPLPAALPLYGAGLAVIGFFGWRRSQTA